MRNKEKSVPFVTKFQSKFSSEIFQLYIRIFKLQVCLDKNFG